MKETGTENQARKEGELRTFVFESNEAISKMTMGSYDKDGTPALWEDGDAIVMKRNSDGATVASAVVECGNTNSGRFTISTTEPAGSAVRILYPSTASYGEGTLPSKQTIKSSKDTVLKYTHAYSDPIVLPENSGKITFELKHALATVKVSYRPDPEGDFGFPSGNQGYVSRITVRTIDSPLSGDYTVDYSTGKVTPGTNTSDYVQVVGRQAGLNVSGSNSSTFTTLPTNGVKEIEVRLHIYHKTEGVIDGEWDVPVLFKGEIKGGELNILDLGYVSLKPEYLSTSRDYYAKWLSGQDIMIGDLAVNKEKFPGAVLVKSSELTESILYAGGLIFIDDKSAATTFCTAPSDGQMMDLTKNGETVIIGRWKDAGSQPDLRLKEMRVSYNDLALLNVKLTSMRTAGGNVFGMNGSSSAFTQLRVVDCYIDARNTKTVVDMKAQDNSFAMKTVYFDNCIVDLPVNKTSGKAENCSYLFHSSSKADSTGGPAQNVIVKNSVLFTSSNTKYTNQKVNIVYLPSKNLKNTNIVFENNTIANFQNNYGCFYFSGSTVKDLSVNYNLSFVEGEAASANDIIMLRNQNNTFTNNPEIDYNFSARNGSRGARISHPSYPFQIGENNIDTSNGASKVTEVFSAKDYSCGYFLIDETKVTNGAGAKTQKKYITPGQ